MRNIWSVAKKELRLYFTSPVAYVVIAVFLFIWGFFFTSIIRWFSAQSLQMAQNPYYYQQMNINEMVFAPLLHNITIFFLFLLPALTMRLFSEEKKLGTEELLYTSPVSVTEIILGKYLASLLMLLIMLGLSALACVFVFVHGNPELLPLLNGYLGLVLMGAAFLAIGLFFSSLTENQVIAVILSIGTLLLLYVLNWAAYSATGMWSDILNYVSFFQHFEDMTKGILDTRDVVYYLSVSFVALFLTHSVIESRRWR